MKIIEPEKKHGIVHRYPTEHNCFRYNAWPTVCKDDRGILYATASGLRLSHVDPCGKNVMWVSFNDGESWTAPIIVNDSNFDDRDTGIVYLGEGKMLMSWFTSVYENHLDHMQDQDWMHPSDKAMISGWSGYWKTLPPEKAKEEWGSFVKLSDDYGVTWSENIRVPVTSPHGPCVAKDGTIYYLGKTMTYEHPYGPDVECWKSTDGGKNWEFCGKVPDFENLAPNQVHEPHIIELPNGRLLGAVRVNGRSEAPVDSTYLTYSDDKGVTWTVPKCIGIDGMPPHFMFHSSGALILSYSCRNWETMSERAVVSYDNGETWSEDYVLDERINRDKQHDMGYPATVELSDGSLLTLYYQALPDDWHTSILYTKWSLNK
ncbi:MAG: exo-alpha-sialidase [Ruminococcaceae bacterium]|nr:exo-alpha-sialidase [Oscillospiraceae bacterium]